MEERKRSPKEQSTQKQTQRPRKRRRRISLVGTLIYVAFIIGSAGLLATVGWVAANDVLALNKEAHSAVLTLPETLFTTEEVEVTTTDKDGEETTKTVTREVADIGHVADYLKENGIIEHKLVFSLYAAFSNAELKLAPGTYTLDTSMDYRAIVTSLGSSSETRMTVKVTIPEGYTVAQIFQKLEDEGVSTVAKLTDMAANYDYGFSFLQDIPLGDANRLEGYLFPDTYEFYMGDNPKYVLNKMMVNFDSRFTDKMRAQCEEMGYSVHEVLTIASLIERETDGTDQALISGVLYNRLENPGAETVGYLQVDAAIAYVTGRTVTIADYTDVKSPYNTYLNKGLTPGPIANPGMVSIYAALNPENTNYYYYVLGKDGLHHFFQTHQGQLDYIAQMNNG